MMTKSLMVRVAAKWRETPEITSFTLVTIDGSPLPRFSAGSHIDVYVTDNIVRQYSLCNAPGDPGHYVIAVKNEPNSRGGSRAMHEKVNEGDILTISEPRNNFGLETTAAHHVLVAGGIGVTPLLCMARQLLQDGASFELHYFTRSLEHTAFHALLSGSEFHGKVQFHYAIAPEGMTTYVSDILGSRNPGAHVYLCGPRPFIELVELTAQIAWPIEAIHTEYFGIDTVALSRDQNAFDVTLARSGGTYRVPEGKTIVQVLAKHGVYIDTSCEEGVCGTCLTRVLGGEVDHRDIVLDEAQRCAGDKIMPCVSRAKCGALILDL